MPATWLQKCLWTMLHLWLRNRDEHTIWEGHRYLYRFHKMVYMQHVGPELFPSIYFNPSASCYTSFGVPKQNFNDCWDTAVLLFWPFFASLSHTLICHIMPENKLALQNIQSKKITVRTLKPFFSLFNPLKAMEENTVASVWVGVTSNHSLKDL